MAPRAKPPSGHSTRTPMRFCLLLVSVVVSGCAGASDETLVRCHEQAEKFGAALAAPDYERLVDLSHPRLIELTGGRDKMISGLRKAAKETGLEVLSLKVERPERIIVAGADVLAVVPVLHTTRHSGKTQSSKSFFLGVSSDQGKAWSFLDGTSLDNNGLKKVLPHFPPGVRLPKVTFRAD